LQQIPDRGLKGLGMRGNGAAQLGKPGPAFPAEQGVFGILMLTFETFKSHGPSLHLDSSPDVPRISIP
ncbi:MAG: hypothetical protein L6425_01970, partial [Candidatus Aminicenantes bacterium]|nr:hypothetical protein [Candidatus Aminicenantes bacterium]